jgi:hypothetical protein
MWHDTLICIIIAEIPMGFGVYGNNYLSKDDLLSYW